MTNMTVLTSVGDGGRGIEEQVRAMGYVFTDQPGREGIWTYSSATRVWSLSFEAFDDPA